MHFRGFYKIFLFTNISQRTKLLPYAAIALCTFFLSAGLTGWRTGAIALACITIFALPGFLLIKKCGFFTHDSLLYGPSLGIAATSLIIMLLVPLAGWNFYLLAGIMLIIIFALLISRHLPGTHSKIPPDPLPINSYNTLSWWETGLVILFEIILFFLFKNVGSPTSSGLAFTGLFGHDFILRGVYSVALAGHVPCDNFFFAGQTIRNYYDLWYILPAAIYNLTDAKADIRIIVALVSFVAVPFFWLTIRNLICFFYAANPQNGASDDKIKKRLPWIFFVVLFCYSYHWVFFLAKKAVGFFEITRFDGFLSEMNFMSQSWLRDCTFEPQAILAIMLGAMIIRLLVFKTSYKRGVVAGFLLSALAMTDTAMFAMIGLSYAVFQLREIAKERSIAALMDAGCVAFTGMVVAAAMFATGIFGFMPHSNSLMIKPAKIIIAGLPFFLLLNFGILPVAAAAAIKHVDFKNSVGARINFFIVVTGIVSLVFMLFLTESLEGNVVLRKALKVLRLPIVLLAAYYLATARPVFFYKAILIGAALSLPVVFSDVYSASAKNDRSCTTYVAADDMKAAQWIKRNTSRTCVVQSCIDYPGFFDYSIVTCFAERRSAMGDWKIAYINYPDLKVLRSRADEIDSLFLSPKSSFRKTIADRLGINYVFVGNEERKRYGECDELFDAGGNDFSLVYKNASVKIFKVETRN